MPVDLWCNFVLYLFFYQEPMEHEAAPEPASVADLRKLIAATTADSESRSVLPFEIDVIDRALPNGGLATGALHQFADDGARFAYAANAISFVAGLLARLDGLVLWGLRSRDLFTPALARLGLDPGRIIFCETWKDGVPNSRGMKRSTAADPTSDKPNLRKARDIFISDLHIDTLTAKGRNFR